jgi:outer membrane protein assembly factor BamB
MKTSHIALWGLVVVLSLCDNRALAVGTPSPIAPGDIIFTEFFDGWHKLNPATGVVSGLLWPQSSSLTRHIDFDLSGAILFDDSQDAIKRLNPFNGFRVDLNIPDTALTDGFVVEANGDLLIANSRAISRFSRTLQTTTTLTTDPFFSPNGIARGADGRVFFTEFFEDLWELNPATGARSQVPTTGLSIPSLIEVRSDGDLIVKSGNLYRIDADTGLAALFSDDLPSSVIFGMALDASDNLWITSTQGIHRYGSSGGTKTLVASGTFFSPRAIAVVPPNWAPVGIPEPSTIMLALSVAAVLPRALRRSQFFKPRPRTRDVPSI